MSDAEEETAIGIDLGTTYCCSAIYDNQSVTVIPNELGGFYTPSYVYINGTEEKVGLLGKEEAFLHPGSTIFNMKQLLGRSFHDPVLQSSIPSYPFKIVKNNYFRNIPSVLVNGESFYLEQIVGKLLYHLKKQAESFLGRPVSRAVVTVPGHYNVGQRQATKDAAYIAGFGKVRLLNETTATAIAYWHQNRAEEEWTRAGKEVNLIFDLGSCSLTVAVVTFEGDHVQVLETGSDCTCGGQHFDTELVTYCLWQFKEKYGVDLSQGGGRSSVFGKDRGGASWKLIQELRDKCEKIKVSLLTIEETTTTAAAAAAVDITHNGVEMKLQLTQENLSALLHPIYMRCLQLIKQVLEDAGVDKSSLGQVILAGSSSKDPKLRQILSDYFEGVIQSSVNEDQAIAYGAALLASKRAGEEQDSSLKFVFKDILTIPIGLELVRPGTNTRYFQVVVRKNCSLPCSKFFSSRNICEKTLSNFTILQGDDEGESGAELKAKSLIGLYQGRDLPKFPKDTFTYLTFYVSEEGILELEAKYETKYLTGAMPLKVINDRLTLGDIVQLRRIELTF